MKIFQNPLVALFIVAIILSISYATINDIQKDKKSLVLSKEETQVLSTSIGHLLAETLKQYQPYYDLKIVIETMKRIENKQEELKSPETYRMALINLDSKLLLAESEQNLRSAEEFLADLSKNMGIFEVSKGKLYYEILIEGKGPRITKAPLFHFTETNLKNDIIRDTRKENKPIRIQLSETILGFSQGVSDMRVGERRKIYVHPDFAYGMLSRQQLSVFDVEILDE